jgi:hypothetical protein
LGVAGLGDVGLSEVEVPLALPLLALPELDRYFFLGAAFLGADLAFAFGFDVDDA